MTLLESIKDALLRHDKTIDDVKSITCSAIVDGEVKDYLVPIKLFKEFAGRVDFDKCNDTIKIVGDNWWFEITVYNEKHWWLYDELPKANKETLPKELAVKVLSNYSVR